MATWMIYGATGYTGVLVAEEALVCGHQPVLAGRSDDKVKALAQRLGLPYVVFTMDSKATALAGLRQVEGLELVLHCAGPFTDTAEPMLEACLELGVHYLDITGEIHVFEHIFAQADRPEVQNIVVMPGVGFDIVPSDCLSKYVADQVPEVTNLTIALDALRGDKTSSGTSAGSRKSGLEMIPGGIRARRNGKLEKVDIEQRWFTFPHGKRATMTATWGDISTAYRTTGIPNITVYWSSPPKRIRKAQRYATLLSWALKFRPLRKFLASRIEQRVDGPTEQAREKGRSYIYAQATAPDGQSAEAWLETREGYTFTALASVRCVEHVLDGTYRGVLTPAAAFGADFVLEIEGTTRYDSLEEASNGN